MDLGDTYLDVTYGSKPFTEYPLQLAREIVSRLDIEVGSLVLDMGCGRGEMAEAFKALGMQVVGVDQASPTIANYSFDFHKSDLEKGLNLESSQFDVVFSKSVLEHFYYPEKLLVEAHRVLKPGGKVVSMTPSWRHNFKMFFDDFSHRTPFTLNSLREIHQYAGFSQVEAHYFIQLPKVWRSKFLEVLSRFLGRLIPDSAKVSKTLRFSREVMLLGHGIKTK